MYCLMPFSDSDYKLYITVKYVSFLHKSNKNARPQKFVFVDTDIANSLIGTNYTIKVKV